MAKRNGDSGNLAVNDTVRRCRMSHRHLNEYDRFYIEQRLSEGDSKSEIARHLGVAPSTISREVRRHTPPDFNGLYNHQVATKLAKQKRRDSKIGSVFKAITGKIRDFIHDRLSTHTSPDVISGELKLKHKVSLSSTDTSTLIEPLVESFTNSYPTEASPINPSVAAPKNRP